MANRYAKAYWNTRRPPPNEQGELRCNSCAKWLHPDFFKKVTRLKYGKDHFCKDCRNAKTREIRYRLHGKVPKHVYEASRAVPPGFCVKCKQFKPLTEFTNRNGDYKRNHSYSCRQCEQARHDAAKLLPGYRERRSANSRRSHQNQKKNPDRIRRNSVRRITIEAVRAGLLIKLPCHCGDTKVQAHHHDYTKPFEVKWLCAIHHRELHRIESLA